VKELASRQVKVALLHSKTDDVIPYSHFEALKPYVTVAFDLNGGHNDTEYSGAIIEAIRAVSK
jgi:predicted esterase